MMGDFLKRVITSIILIVILLFSIFYNQFSLLIILLLVTILSFYEFSNLIKKIYKKKNNEIYFFNFISFIYLLFFAYSSYMLSFNQNFLIYAVFVCIFSDIGGYVVGRTLGGKKLTKISPNKTVSGSIGSFVFSFFPFIIFINYNNFDSIFAKLLIINFFLSLTSQVGDLIISFFKRKAKVKDTGSILPGHGGLLDRIDGLIFVIPISFLIYKVFLNL
tara:strand:+ start:1097 stop:1750 length:654 start_codon:yes stop_codon:yes gene_type:complete